MGLFKPAWMSENIEKALAAVAKLIDQAEIARVVEESRFPKVKEAALAKLTDEDRLFSIALWNPKNKIGLTAAGKIRNPNRLVFIVENAIDADVCLSMAALLPDSQAKQVAYAKAVCLNEKYAAEVLPKITDYGVFTSIPDKTKRSYRVQPAYYKREVEFKTIGGNGGSFPDALEKISDNGRLANIARDRGLGGYIRIAAIHRIADQNTLKKLAIEFYDYLKGEPSDGEMQNIALEVIRKLATDKAVTEIIETFNNGDKPWIPSKILENTTLAQNVFEKYARDPGNDDRTRISAIKNMTNIDSIRGIAATDADLTVSLAACEKSGIHMLDGCKCTICRNEVHNWEQTGSEVNNIDRTSETYYRCRRCGKTKISYASD